MVYLFKARMVIFHGELLNNQRVIYDNLLLKCFRSAIETEEFMKIQGWHSVGSCKDWTHRKIIRICHSGGVAISFQTDDEMGIIGIDLSFVDPGIGNYTNILYGDPGIPVEYKNKLLLWKLATPDPLVNHNFPYEIAKIGAFGVCWCWTTPIKTDGTTPPSWLLQRGGRSVISTNMHISSYIYHKPYLDVYIYICIYIYMYIYV